MSGEVARMSEAICGTRISLTLIRATAEEHMRRLILVLAAAIALSFADCAAAQTYPTRPVTIIVPFPAGGPTDTLARILADRLKASLNQVVVIENVSGAGGSIGVGKVARSTPDGYTISIGHVQTHVLNGAVYNLAYDVLNDFDPIALVADVPQFIAGTKAVPADDLKGLVAWMKANPGKATVGAVGVGGLTDIFAAYFAKHAGVTFQLVPYRGGAPLLQDLLGAQIDLTFGQAATYLAHVRSGQIKAYAVLTERRWWAMPDIPTIEEAGGPAFFASFWHGMWAPRGTPKPVISRLTFAVQDALADAAVRKRFADVGQDIWPREQQTPEALADQHKAEVEKWWPIIKAAGIKAE
jgi:tripartite-type tricarboxylate transporter receptor subunit TctC